MILSTAVIVIVIFGTLVCSLNRFNPVQKVASVGNYFFEMGNEEKTFSKKSITGKIVWPRKFCFQKKDCLRKVLDSLT